MISNKSLYALTLQCRSNPTQFISNKNLHIFRFSVVHKIDTLPRTQCRGFFATQAYDDALKAAGCVAQSGAAS
jgi:hypothetical protein